MQKDVFISYKSGELAYTEKVAKYLEDNDINVWYAPRNLTHNASGELFDDAIADAIKDVRVVVVMVSEQSLTSHWVRAEVQRAEKTGKFIIPFVISEYSADNGLVMRLEMLHMILAYPDLESQLPVLLENVRRHLSDGPVADASMPLALDFSSNKKKFSGRDYAYEEGMALYESGEKLESVEFFLRSAQRGNKEARSILCEIFYEQNRDFDKIDEGLWNTIESVSDQGEAFADFLMHCKYYAMGNQNVIALRYLQKSLEREEIPLALLRMGVCYNWGLGVKQNHILGIHYYEKALELGCKQAYSYIAQEYLWGNDKIKKSLDKAEHYILEGIEKGDSRCYSRLQNLYSDKPEKICETAQKMIDEGVEGGYTMMAEYYSWGAAEEERDNDKAIEWAFKALDANEKGAYGLVSLLYYSEDTEEALKYARIGVEQYNDGQALYLLGWDSEMEDDYAAAWNQYMVRYEKYGSGAEDLGRLFIEREYMPEGYNVADLKQILMIGARNYSLESLKYLLQIMIYERTGKRQAIAYDRLREIAEAYEYIELGAEMGDAQLRYIQGRIMIEVAGCHYNPRKGREIITSLAMASVGDDGYLPDAVFYMLTHTEKDVDKWMEIALDREVNFVRLAEEERSIPRMVAIVRESKINDAALWMGCLERLSNIEHFNGERCPLWFALVDKAFSLRGEDDGAIDEALMRKVRDSVVEAVDCPMLLKDVKRYFDIIFPGYSKEEIVQRGSRGVDEETWRLFCIACSDAYHWKYCASEQLEELFKPLLEDKEFMSALGRFEDYNMTGTKRLKASMDEFEKYFNEVCEDYGYTPKVQLRVLNYGDTAPFTHHKLLMRIIENRVECMLEILPLLDEETRKKVVDNLDNHSKLLDVAESLNFSGNLQLLLIDYVENMIEVDALFGEQAKLIDQFLKGGDEGKRAIDGYLAEFREKVVNWRKDDEEEWVQADGDEEQEKDSSDAVDNDDFDKLLDDFINKHLEDE